MGPRIHSKPNLRAEAEAQSVRQPTDLGAEETRSDNYSADLNRSSNEGTGVARIEEVKNEAKNTLTSWYGGAWTRGVKATPVTQIAKESITAAGEAASEIVASTRAPPFPTVSAKSRVTYLSRSIRSSVRPLPLPATTTKLNITCNAPSGIDGAETKENPLNNNKNNDNDNSTTYSLEHRNHTKSQSDNERELADTTAQEYGSEERNFGSHSKINSSKGPEPSGDSAGWLSWFYKYEPKKNGSIDLEHTDSEAGNNEIAATGQPQSIKRKIADRVPPCFDADGILEPSRSDSTELQQEQSSRAWLGLWGNVATEIHGTSSACVSDNIPDVSKASGMQLQTSVEGNSNPGSYPQPSPRPVDNARSYGWAFWLRDQSKSCTGKEVPGSLGLAGSPSQSKPEYAVVDKAQGIPEKFLPMERSQSPNDANIVKKERVTDGNTRTNSVVEPVSVTAKAQTAADTGSKARQSPANQLLPEFKHTFITAGRPSLVQHIGRLLQFSYPSAAKHVEIVQSPPKIKKPLAIGVHGYFPAPLIRSVLGQPTGTSIRFANNAADAIQKWTENQGYSCEIEKVALEGEGKIEERLDLLWKLMLNWIEKIRLADFIMIACHSQGVPVAMMLVAKLIAFGCVNSARIGVCAMAGVNLGPFAEYKSRWIGGSAGELFDFAYPDSKVSKDYKAALDVDLRFGVRVVYIGSIDDQLVSLESSTFMKISHPYIYRAVFIDGRVHAPDFLTHLVGLVLRIRNIGLSDHGLIKELSSPLAGSLYSGEGHSRIYDDESVYYLAVEHALETTSVGNVPLQMQRESSIHSQNPYILPFAMRGLLEEEYIRTELHGEVTQLLNQFDDWKPSSKVLKDVKFRLEGVRSKL